MVAQDGPFFDFPKFKNAIRELLYTSQNTEKLERQLKLVYKISDEIVDLWNEKISSIERNADSQYSDLPNQIARVEFHAETLKMSWWSDEKSFDSLSPIHLSNQDFASFAVSIANFINNEIIHGEEIKIEKIEKNFVDDFIKGIKHLTEKNESESAIKNILEGINHEAPFRDYFDNWFAANSYRTHREPLRGENHIDLEIEHESIAKSIIEFKGWWNDDKKNIIQQLFNYLTEFDGEGYIFMINNTGGDINSRYEKMIKGNNNGYIGDWKAIPYKNSAFTYFKSKHNINGHVKLVYHFILTIQKPFKKPKKVK